MSGPRGGGGEESGGGGAVPEEEPTGAVPGEEPAGTGPVPGEEPAGGRDPGLQPERTRLAWRRTTLSCTVAAVLAVKTTLHGGVGTLHLVAAALCLLVWLGFLVVAHCRIRDLALHETSPPAMTRRAAVVAVACSVALAVFAVAMVV
ncbi:DUF202 domain-containing protein [Streptomyces sp. NPDC058067]|uniref:DUF202 domain-containing protein n=1 Tax=Streptomyces sp. NPDC058067 TaxID=3346324 RepID=UPI0036E96253